MPDSPFLSWLDKVKLGTPHLVIVVGLEGVDAAGGGGAGEGRELGGAEDAGDEADAQGLHAHAVLLHLRYRPAQRPLPQTLGLWKKDGNLSWRQRKARVSRWTSGMMLMSSRRALSRVASCLICR